jgi:hypothetical protein
MKGGKGTKLLSTGRCGCAAWMARCAQACLALERRSNDGEWHERVERGVNLKWDQRMLSSSRRAMSTGHRVKRGPVDRFWQEEKLLKM